MGKLFSLLVVTALLVSGCGSVSNATPESDTTLVPTSLPPPTATLNSITLSSPRDVLVATAPPDSDCAARPLEFIWRYAGDPKAKQKYVPGGVDVDDAGHVYVVDSANHQIQKLDSAGQLLTQWGREGDGDGQFRFTLDHPWLVPGAGPYADVQVDGQGHVFVTDRGNFRIQKFDSNGQFITQWGRRGRNEAEFDLLTWIAVDAQGYVYVADCFHKRIQQFDNDGKFIAVLPTNFYPCAGAAIDRAGCFYIAMRNIEVITRFDQEWNKMGVWTRTAGRLDYPIDMTVDNRGNLFIVGHFSHNLVMFDPNGRCRAQLGAQGLGNGQFYYPTDVAVDQAGNLYVVGSFVGVQKLRPVLEETP